MKVVTWNEDWTPKQSLYYTKSDLLERGWSESMITNLYPVPDKTTPNRHKRSFGDVRLYLRENVEAIEQTSEFNVLMDQKLQYSELSKNRRQRDREKFQKYLDSLDFDMKNQYHWDEILWRGMNLTHENTKDDYYERIHWLFGVIYQRKINLDEFRAAGFKFKIHPSSEKWRMLRDRIYEEVAKLQPDFTEEHYVYHRQYMYNGYDDLFGERLDIGKRNMYS